MPLSKRNSNEGSVPAPTGADTARQLRIDSAIGKLASQVCPQVVEIEQHCTAGTFERASFKIL